MATPFQKQAQQRKILYLALIVVLFSGAFWLRANVIDEQARALAIREQTRGEVELLGSAVRLGLTGSRGLVTCILWHSAFEAQKKNQWNELELTVRALTKLQPHFIAPWLFQSWNLAYNVSVEADRPRDKYFYIARGIELLAKGERQNLHQPDIRWNIGNYTMSKINKSDETNYQRSLFQLSMIPPVERDPARFWRPVEGEDPAFDYGEFEKFCEAHPQLVRRLAEGMHRDNMNERKKLFKCDSPRDVVQFLEDNWTVPSLYQTAPLAAGHVWAPGAVDTLLPETDRFPALPPRLKDTTFLTSSSNLGDEVDSPLVGGAWFAYSLEPIPEPDRLPGSTKPPTDPATQRRPKNITTLIFRDYPAKARRTHAERLQEEGWFDETPWLVPPDWLKDSREHAGRDVKVGGRRKWSQLAWQQAYQAWKTHGEENHLLFNSQEEERNMRSRAEAFEKKFPQGPDAVPASRFADDPVMAEQHFAAQYVKELKFYRDVSNYMHHLNRCFVEQNPEAVACRKAFFTADRLNFSGNPFQALRVYRDPVADPAWGGPKLDPLTAWRELVLKKNKDFRNDSQIQEGSAEIQYRFQSLENRFDGRELKQKLTAAAAVVPLLPATDPDAVRYSVTPGPFDALDDEGKPYVSDAAFRTAAERMRLKTRRMELPERPAATPPTEKP